MKSRAKQLCDSSISSALAAIEIYNKPNFPHREQVFCILMVSAWETLFKARILAQHQNRLSSVYVPDEKWKGRYLMNHDKTQYITIGLIEAMGRCSVSNIVVENIKKLIDVRNAAIHFTATSAQLPKIVFMLGAATLKNYALLLEDWFGTNLNRYNFFILPLGFDYPFTTFSLAPGAKEPEEVLALISSVAKLQEGGKDKDSAGFTLVCEFQASVVAAKKIKDTPDFVVTTDPSITKAVLVERCNLLDEYPLSYKEVFHHLKQKDPTVKQSQLNDLIKENEIKSNPKYAAPNFRNALQKAAGVKSSTTFLYNRNFLNFAEQKLCE
ncbi:MAG: DUF3644 domain-containing protein [Limisphaerales bacterium]